MPHDHPDHDEPSPRPPFLPKKRGSAHAAPAQIEASPAALHPRPLARGAGHGKLLFLDAFSGIAGDMLVAGLCDLGVPQDVLEAALRSLPISGYELRFVARTRSSILARGLD
ncbi:MAG: nickel insertion protein, partial [Polyangiales bacterium]